MMRKNEGKSSLNSQYTLNHISKVMNQVATRLVAAWSVQCPEVQPFRIALGYSSLYPTRTLSLHEPIPYLSSCNGFPNDRPDQASSHFSTT
jgi:hypothetical protein